MPTYVTFQSATPATAPANTKVAVDNDGTGDWQYVKIVYGADGTRTPVSTTNRLPVKIGDGTDDLAINTAGSAQVDPRPAVTRIQVSQTTNASAYAAKAAIGGAMTFANAARTSGGSIHIESVTLVDEDQQLAAIDLVLFRDTISATDDTAFDPNDAELLTCVGVVKFTASDYSDFTDNAVAHKDVALTATLAGTSLYGVLVARGTPTYASTSSVHCTVTIVQD